VCVILLEKKIVGMPTLDFTVLLVPRGNNKEIIKLGKVCDELTSRCCTMPGLQVSGAGNNNR
jgi:hypothetical protein